MNDRDLRRRAIEQLLRFLEETPPKERRLRERRKDAKDIIAAKRATTEQLRSEVGR
jgi:CRISPR/Cas system CSM-associated protein Csm2 small subunit